MANGKRKLEIVIAGNARGAQKAFAATKKGAKGVGKAFKGLGIVGAAGLAVAGAAVFKFGDAFNKAKNDIAQATGATGDALDGLYSDFKTTLGNVPDDMATVSGAIGAANTLFAATGDELSTLTERVLDMSRMAGGDATSNMEALGKAAAAFGLDAAGATAATNDLFAVSQNYAIGADVLLKSVNKYGPIFSTAGFSMGETAAIMGQLNAAGVDLRKTVPGIEQFTAAAVKAGDDPKKAMAAVEEQIRNAASSTDALAIAQQAFGTSAPFMVSAIRDSNVQFANAGAVLGDNAGLLSDTAKATASLGEKFKEFKNKALAALEPAISKAFGALMEGMDWMSEHAVPFIQKKLIPAVREFITKALPHVQAFGRGIRNALAPVIAWLQSTIVPAVKAVADAFSENGLAGVVDLLKAKGSELMTTLKPWAPAFAAVGAVVVAMFGAWAVSAALAAAATIAAAAPFIAIGVAIGAVAAGFVWAYQNVDTFRNVVDAVVRFVKNNWLPAFEGLTTVVKSVIESIVGIAKPVIQYFKDVGELFNDLFHGRFKEVFHDLVQIIKDQINIAIAWFKLVPGKLASAFIDVAGLAWGRISGKLGEWATSLLGWVNELPGKFVGAASGMFDFIKDAFRSTINWLIDKWNGLTFKMPSFNTHIPKVGTIGGFNVGLGHIPRIHSGGTFLPPGGGREGLAMLRRGERVLTPGQASPRAGGGGGDLVLMISGREFGRISRDQLVQLSNTEGPMPIRIAS